MLARLSITVLLTLSFVPVLGQKAGDEAQGSLPYDRFQQPDACASCHLDIHRQHEQAMMSQSYTHHWDEIEYFKLALPHSEKEEKVAGIKAGCNGCHAPLAFLARDIPPGVWPGVCRILRLRVPNSMVSPSSTRRSGAGEFSAISPKLRALAAN